MSKSEYLDSLKQDESYYACERSEMLGFIPKDCRSVLEVGCAGGSFGETVKKLTGAEVWGIEINKKAAEKASGMLDKVITADFYTAINEIPLNYFDCIVLNDVLEHFTNPYDVLEKIKSFLKDNGYIIASIPNVRYITNLKELLFDKDWKYKDNGILDFTHYRFFTKKSINRMFAECGYEILLLDGINPIQRKFLFFIFNFLSFGIFSDSKYLQFACVASKK